MVESLCLKQDKNKINSFIIAATVRSLAYSKQPLYQQQMTDFMKALFLLYHRKWEDGRQGKFASQCF